MLSILHSNAPPPTLSRSGAALTTARQSATTARIARTSLTSTTTAAGCTPRATSIAQRRPCAPPSAPSIRGTLSQSPMSAPRSTHAATRLPCNGPLDRATSYTTPERRAWRRTAWCAPCTQIIREPSTAFSATQIRQRSTSRWAQPASRSARGERERGWGRPRV